MPHGMHIFSFDKHRFTALLPRLKVSRGNLKFFVIAFVGDIGKCFICFNNTVKRDVIQHILQCIKDFMTLYKSVGQ